MVANDTYIVNTQHLRFARKFDCSRTCYGIELHFIETQQPQMVHFKDRNARDDFFNEIVEKTKIGLDK